MRFVSWNVNGFRACLSKNFEEYFQELDADFFCIQETKMQEGQASFAPQGYYQFWNSAIKKGYSGTAIFAKHQPLNVRYGIEDPLHDTEGRAITLEYENFFLLNVYTPNSQRELTRLEYRMQWEDALRAYILKLNSEKPVIYCGDLNVAHQEIDLKNPKTNTSSAGFTLQERTQLTKLLESGFCDTFRHQYPQTIAYSWWSYMYQARQKNIGWRIDYFIISDCLKSAIQDAFILGDKMGSDHCPVMLDLTI